MHVIKEVICCNYLDVHIVINNTQQYEIVVDLIIPSPRENE